MKLEKGDIVYIQKEDNSDPYKWHKSKEIYIIRNEDEQSIHLRITHEVDNEYIVYKEFIYAKSSKIFLYFKDFLKSDELSYLEFICVCNDLRLPSQVVEKFVNICNGEKINKRKIHYMHIENGL